ncbi:hypothetical protein GH721_09295 [Kriegella sp. EG-1]|nr:hypothetical protein [Flavobacteriaceae bacterium EG-1]
MKNKIHLELNKNSNIQWDELYVLSGHWKSDLEFYRDDLRFLHHIIQKYLMWITTKVNMDMVRIMETNLKQLAEKCEVLLKSVSNHQIEIGRFIDKSTDSTVDRLQNEHVVFEEEIADFVKSFRNNRKEVFKITEYIIDSEKLPHILES